jgi:AmmeMemoRadiSam system protein A
MILSDSDKEYLLTLARRTVEHCINREERVAWETHSVLSEGVKHRCGAFVSIYIEGKLRGCIGTFSEEEPLYKNVRQMAISAATADDRFSRVESDELDKLSIEISVLTPRKRIHDTREIVLGKHGIYMVRGSNRGTLLPQVAIHQGWSVEEFLGNCAKFKAGVGWDGWKSADLYTYEAIVFYTGNRHADC